MRSLFSWRAAVSKTWLGAHGSARFISVGASVAIMGLFAAMLVASVHYPPGPIRSGLQLNAVYVLIPSLLPLAGGLQGDQIDYASHFGGAIARVAVGFVMLAVWSPREPWPGLRGVAATTAIAGVAWPTPPSPSRTVIRTLLFDEAHPSDELPQTNAEMYPRDPRPRNLLAAELLDGGRGKTGSHRLFRRSSLAPDIAGTTCRWLAGDLGNCA